MFSPSGYGGGPWIRRSLCGCRLSVGIYFSGLAIIALICISQGYKLWYYFDDRTGPNDDLTLGGEPDKIPDELNVAFLGGLAADILLIVFILAAMLGAAMSYSGSIWLLVYCLYAVLYVVLSVAFIILIIIQYANWEDELAPLNVNTVWGVADSDEWRKIMWGERFAVFLILWILIDIIVIYALVMAYSLYSTRDYDEDPHEHVIEEPAYPPIGPWVPPPPIYSRPALPAPIYGRRPPAYVGRAPAYTGRALQRYRPPQAGRYYDQYYRGRRDFYDKPYGMRRPGLYNRF